MSSIIQNNIAIVSGKGGVGKSTVAVNVALALAHLHKQTVGILDADIYGPSLPLMLGVKSSPQMTENKKFKPLFAHGLQSMSIGYLIKEESAMAWRGPMASRALVQLYNDTLWENLHYLIIDLPPGTGDIQLTLAQKIPLAGAIVVTTPQDLSLIDARRACEMFRKVNVPVLGVVENMSLHVCTHCGHEEAIFGTGGGLKLAQEYGLSIISQLPLDASIGLQIDIGKPTVIADGNSNLAKKYDEIAQYIINNISKPKSPVFPKIEIKND